MKWLFSLFFISSFLCSSAQVDSITPPFKKFPTLPPIQLTLADSTTKFTKEDFIKNKPVMLMVFSPECSHCKHTAEQLYKYKDSLPDIQIVMVTMHPTYLMNAFIEKYKLNEIPNLTAARDLYYFTPSFYKISSLPFMVFYDKKGNLISSFEGTMTIPKVIEMFKKKGKK